MRSHRDVIAAFGGQMALARLLGLPELRTIHWNRRGIPAKYWPCIEETEVGRTLGITAGRLKRLPPAPEPEPAEAA